MERFTQMTKGSNVVDTPCLPEYKYTFTTTVKSDESTQKMLNELASNSKHIVVVERKKGFTEIHSDSGVEYTTEDIMSKGL